MDGPVFIIVSAVCTIGFIISALSTKRGGIHSRRPYNISVGFDSGGKRGIFCRNVGDGDNDGLRRRGQSRSWPVADGAGTFGNLGKLRPVTGLGMGLVEYGVEMMMDELLNSWEGGLGVFSLEHFCHLPGL